MSNLGPYEESDLDPESGDHAVVRPEPKFPSVTEVFFETCFFTTICGYFFFLAFFLLMYLVRVELFALETLI